MGIRKYYRNLTDVERDRFVQALYQLKSTGLVDRLAEIHALHFFHNIHRSSHFLPWHREMLLRFERALQEQHPDITIPYWDSTVDRNPSDPLWNNNFLGQFDSAWNLGRALGSGPLPTSEQVRINQGRDDYDIFWRELENPIHNRPHVWVEGVMGGAASPGDPVFYLHHCWIDMLWARWQLAHPEAPFVASGPGVGLDDPLMEWPDRTPVDVLDHHALGYTYDSEVLIDRSAEFGTPPAAGAPTACVIPELGVHNIAYRDTSGRLHELWRDAQGVTGTTNLTENANAPTAVGNPFAYVDTSRNTEILLYRGDDGTVRSLYWSTGPVGHDNLSGTAGAPGAAGDPVGYYAAAADTHHVIYRTDDGHLHELNWTGTAPVIYGGNLTGAISAPTAAGQPSAFVNAAGANLVVYRSVNNQILSLYWAEGPSGLDDLSGVAGTPPAAGDPVAYYTAHNDTHQVVYLGDDGHLWELYWAGVAPVVGWDLTAPSGAPAAAGTPAACYSAGTNTKHVIYHSADGRLHEIWWTPGDEAPAHVDLTALASAPLAADRPAAFTVEGPNSQHVAYRGTDNHIYEVRW